MVTNKGDNFGFGLQALINQANGTFADETVSRLGTSSVNPNGGVCYHVRLADFKWPVLGVHRGAHERRHMAPAWRVTKTPGFPAGPMPSDVEE